MEPQTIELSRLQELSATSLQLTYNADAADTLSLTLRPENYAELPLQALDRLTVTDGDRIVFSGVVPAGCNCAAEAAAGETVEVELQSDYYVLDHTVYAKVDPFGRPMFARKVVEGSTTTVAKVVQGIETWLGHYLPSKLTCEASAVVPSPSANGTAPCTAVLNDCLRWVPDVVTVQRYGEQNSITVTTPEKLGEPLVFSPATHPLQSVSLKPRHDLQVPVCALVGGVHSVYPTGGDIREPGAFVYAVPLDPEDETQNGGAGSAPASQKMIVRGVPVPERKQYVSSKDEHLLTKTIADSNTAKFVTAYFPEYVPFIPYLRVGSCLIDIVPEAQAFEKDEDEKDEDAKIPANYRGEASYWKTLENNVYVHAEGSFAASTRKKRNIKGLTWCKAKIGIILAVQMNESDVPRKLWGLAEELFPGRQKGDGNRYAYVRKTLSCNLINRRKKVYDPATNKLCSTDSEYNEQQEQQPEETPTMLDYKAAMAQYYKAANKLQHEGSIGLLYDGTINPAELTGRRVLVDGLRPEWSAPDMQAIIRSVQWDYAQRKLSLTLGTRAVMGFDEYLERRLIARNRGRDKAQQEAIAYDPADEEAQKEEEDSMSVSPSITAETDSNNTGKWVKPFKLFVTSEGDDSKVMLKGGHLRKGTQTFYVEDTEKQIENGKKGSKDWEQAKKVKLRWKLLSDGSYTYDIYQL